MYDRAYRTLYCVAKVQDTTRVESKMGHKLNGVFISETTALSCAGSAFGPSTWITALVPPPPPRDALASSPPPRDHRLRGGRGASPTSASASGASHLPDSNARCNDF